MRKPTKPSDESVRKPDSREERETVITWSDADATATVYSCQKRMIAKLRSAAASNGCQVRDCGMGGIEVDLPLACIRIVSGRRRLTAEQRAAAADRLAKARAAKAR